MDQRRLEYRKRYNESPKGIAANAARAKRRYADPELKKIWAARASARAALPEFRLKNSIRAAKRNSTAEGKAANAAYRRTRRQVVIAFRLGDILRTRLHDALARVKSGKGKSASKLVGCSIAELTVHLESLFLPGMSWENYGRKGWHIDHKRPCASFDLTDPEQQRQCFHYTNLQPLWAKDNLVKGDSWSPS